MFLLVYVSMYIYVMQTIILVLALCAFWSPVSSQFNMFCSAQVFHLCNSSLIRLNKHKCRSFCQFFLKCNTTLHLQMHTICRKSNCCSNINYDDISDVFHVAFYVFHTFLSNHNNVATESKVLP